MFYRCPRVSTLLALALGHPGVSRATQAPVVGVDTITYFRLLPGATIVRLDSAPACFDCGWVSTTTVTYEGKELRLRSVEDLPLFWSALPSLPPDSGPDAVRNRLLGMLRATNLPGRFPRLVTDRTELSALARALTTKDTIGPPREAREGGERVTTFFVSTADALYRLNARLDSRNRLKLASTLIRCYLCP
jgi:hypothetical protein